MIRLIFLFLATTCASSAYPQIASNLVQDPEFDKTIRQYLDFTIPVISCEELKEMSQEVLLLDARELEEYKVSHIKDAQHIGYKKLDKKVLQKVSKDQKIVVYCSIGYRSEKVGEKLHEMGFHNVSNLYGSIFEWVNLELPIFDETGEETNNLHTYNRSWSKWVGEGKAKKIW